MNTMRSNQTKPRSEPHRRRRGFTLTELLVAIAVVALLTVAIGQVFQSVQRIVSGGIATAEVNQLARALERQMRDDFEALGRMDSSETFIAIRMREIGDIDRSGSVADKEQTLYLSTDDKDADLRSQIDNPSIKPYKGGRAVTRRVDEIMFIAPPGDGAVFTSRQFDHLKDQGNPPDQRIQATASAPFARIYYGHALRPAPDLNFKPDNNTGAIPIRQYVPDGDFGQPAGKDNRFNTSRLVTGLNQYAGDWILARHALLLFGGLATGYPEIGSPRTAAIGTGREYTPYIRDLEALDRFQSGQLDLRNVKDEVGVLNLFRPDFPEPRLASWGRVDLCAQSLRDVRRWLEGENGLWMSPEPITSPAFEVGRFTDQTTYGDGANSSDFTHFLWQRADPRTGSPDQRLEDNERGLRTAIAGCFFRPQAESSPPPVDRAPPAINIQSEDALMDTHAVFATRCSNFEIAWSDGSTALADIDLDLNSANGPELRTGDLIWFDISPTNPTDASNSRSTYTWWINNHARDADLKMRDVNSATFPEITRKTAFIELDERDNGSATNSGDPRRAVYNTIVSGGSERGQEYLAIWPFRKPTSSGQYAQTFPKELLIRVRLTLHDEQFRLKDGKKFEFIFRVNPKTN